MKKEYLVAVDLEGVHGILGAPYEGLHTGAPDYEKAIENATDEVNVVVKALFDGGATRVAVWDNHWQGKNLDFSKIDARAIRVENPFLPKYERMAFAKDFSFDGVLFIGYHAKEGSLNGILAHSYSSKVIQYYKINGVSVGEIEIDSWVAAEQSFAPLFCSADEVCVQQALVVESNLQTVVTKIGTGRNSGVLREKEDVLKEMYEKAFACTKMQNNPKKLAFPARLEVRYTRAEDALKRLEKTRKYGQDTRFGEDAHVLVTTLRSIADLESFL